jgi:hypothetical protein
MLNMQQQLKNNSKEESKQGSDQVKSNMLEDEEIEFPDEIISVEASGKTYV